MKTLIECPRCGKQANIEVDETTRKKSFDCPRCLCHFELVFNRHLIEDELKERFMQAPEY
jgi:transposase-like protein